MLSPVVANSVIVLVSLVWLVNFAAPFVVADYSSDPQLNLVFMSVVGGALALRNPNHGTGNHARP